MPKGLYLMDEYSYTHAYGPEVRQQIAELVDIYAPHQTRDTLKNNPAILAQADIIFSGWGMPLLDQAFLDAAPRLKAVFYAAGSIRSFITDECWKRGIVITTAAEANAVPVAEYTLACITFGLKKAFGYARSVREAKTFPESVNVPGAFDSKVGLVSLGLIGRLVAQKLQQMDVTVLAYDPFVSAPAASQLGVKLVSLTEIFSQCDVVSLHTPWLKQTENMVGASLLSSMKPGAAFINTARGAVVNEKEMIAVLAKRPDLQAILDVTHPEPPEADSPLYALPNVFLTPHLAGSMGPEIMRMGRYMVEELRRYLKSEPLRWQVTREKAEISA